MLNLTEEKALVGLAQGGDQKAMAKLIKAYMPMIRKYARTSREENQQDVESEMILAFIEHLPKFEIDRGFRVGTYMRWWLRQSLIEYNHHNFDIITAPMGGATTRIVTRVKRAKRDLNLVNEHSDEGRDAIAAKAGVTLNEVAFSETWGTPRITRLDAPISADNDDYDGRTADIVAESIDIIAKMTLAQRRTAIKLNLERLKPREREVLQRRWLGEEEETLGDIGQEWGVSRERVRQVEVNALTKLTSYIGVHSRHLVEPNYIPKLPKRSNEDLAAA